jgi:hypothetical protein
MGREGPGRAKENQMVLVLKSKIRFRSPALAVVFLLGCLLSVSAHAQATQIGRAKALMEGTWQLDEWVVDGEVLKPPQADGRLSQHDGVIMIMMSWSRPSMRKFFYGYGTYLFTESTWSYEYDRYVAFADEGGKVSLSERGAAERSTRAGFEGRRIYQMKFDGDRLVLEHEGGQRQLIYEGDMFSYVEHGKPLRKWRRVPDQ